MRDCGGCQHFQKWKNDKYGGGICFLKDARTKTDHGHKCKTWKSIPYVRERKFWRVLKRVDRGGGVDAK